MRHVGLCEKMLALLRPWRAFGTGWIMRYGGSADYKVNELRARVTIVWLAVGHVLIQFRCFILCEGICPVNFEPSYHTFIVANIFDL